MVFEKLKSPLLRLLQPLLAQFFLLTTFFVASKLAFLFFYGKGASATDMLQTLWHGLPLDFSISAWLTLFSTLLTLVSIFIVQMKVWRCIIKTYFAIASITLAAVVVLNISLYAYWQFPLDTTPLFYFLSSPADALASAPLWQTALGCAVTAILTGCLYFLLVRHCLPTHTKQSKRIAATALLLALGGILFITGRGGVTVSTMNTGRAYFSDRPVLNHAAVNPCLSLGESIARENNFASQYRFFTNDEVLSLFDELNRHNIPDDNVTAGDTILNTDRPDVLFVILESFSSHLLPSLGGSPVALQLDSVARDGLLFTDFYANSFRTDRGLVSVLSAFPAQPTNSLMKYPHKTQRLPSIASALKQEGYTTSYYYGGDADFTNMRSYLISAGFSRIISDTDFPIQERLSKWGAPDEAVFNRLLTDIKAEKADGRRHLRVVQTSSSHEPFDVPAYHRYDDPIRNAFAYTDSCLGHFLRELSHTERWKRTLVVIVPDHQGCWPDTLDNLSPERYRIPLVLTGGALRQKGCNATTGMQTDIVATLLHAMHIPAEDFPFSKDLLNAALPHYAFFAYPNAMGLVRNGSCAVFDNAASKPHLMQGPKSGDNLRYAKAFLQYLYDTIAAL